MEVEILEKINWEDYDSCINNYNFSTFFHSSKFLRLLEKLLECNVEAIGIREKGELIGILPYMIKKTKHGSVINSLPYYGSYGGAITQKKEYTEIILKKFDELNNEKDLLSTVIIENPFDNSHDLYKKYFKHNYIDQRITQCTKLDSDETQFFKKLGKQVRWSIKKSDRNNIIIQKSSLNENIISDFFNFHKKNMEEKNGQFKNIEFFKNVRNIFEQENDYDVFIGLKDDKPISFLLVFYFNKFTEYYMPAQDSEFKSMQSASRLIWESIRESIKRNNIYYNFGGTPKENVSLYKFKKSWNSIDYNYKYYISADIKKIKEVDLEVLKKSFQNFYIIPYNEIKNE